MSQRLSHNHVSSYAVFGRLMFALLRRRSFHPPSCEHADGTFFALVSRALCPRCLDFGLRFSSRARSVNDNTYRHLRLAHQQLCSGTGGGAHAPRRAQVERWAAPLADARSRVDDTLPWQHSRRQFDVGHSRQSGRSCEHVTSRAASMLRVERPPHLLRRAPLATEGCSTARCAVARRVCAPALASRVHG